jgi:hypothetical protein
MSRLVFPHHRRRKTMNSSTVRVLVIIALILGIIYLAMRIF